MTVYGVGINDILGFKRATPVTTYIYRVWHGILQRCYSPKCQEKHPTYKGCTVDPRWLKLSGFVEGIKTLSGYDKFIEYVENRDKYSRSQKIELDKDSIVLGNKVYGPDTCCFITAKENREESYRRHKKFGTGLYSKEEVERRHHAKFPPNAIVNSNKVRSKPLIVSFDGETQRFPSIAKGARFIGCDPKLVQIYLKTKKAIKGKYTVRLEEEQCL